ncbi:MAG: hypothetical protein QOI10_4305 [Solirubrobacterales bacterium]|nr:hypothetical protein [Solirubrobacterales bacterium]
MLSGGSACKARRLPGNARASQLNGRLRPSCLGETIGRSPSALEDVMVTGDDHLNAAAGPVRRFRHTLG